MLEDGGCRDERDAVETAVDWLIMVARDYLIKEKPLPELPLGSVEAHLEEVHACVADKGIV